MTGDCLWVVAISSDAGCALGLALYREVVTSLLGHYSESKYNHVIINIRALGGGAPMVSLGCLRQ